jgi:hypothetical protein
VDLTATIDDLRREKEKLERVIASLEVGRPPELLHDAADSG